MTEFRGEEDKRRTRPSHTAQPELTEFSGQEENKRRTRPGHRAQPHSAAERHRVDRVQEEKAWTQSPATETSQELGARPRGGQEEDKAWTQGPARQPSHRVDRVQGRGQEEDKRRTRPSHRAQPRSPPTA